MNDTAVGSATPIFDSLVAEIGLQWPGLTADADHDETAASLADTPEPQVTTAAP
ncbi:hypothetical protein [Amycolatopsis sp. RTGN1]|uniref:hypothetical protein n=1 Tax=Amycolatopsis ponsaeliensis TaxID=2992142 RepID=UPI00254B538E|nr:hypothetical protein [Amycolatopsis sp. RTGN1]